MYIFLIIIILIIIFGVALYNRLVRLKIRTEEGWADIDIQLKRRYDLIPNLVETVKAYADHERATLQELLEARSKATSMNVDLSTVTPQQMEAFAGAQSGLTGALGKLLAVAESYPDLKANENFLELQRELSDTENKIQAARRFYNGTVREFKTATLSFPTNILAVSFGFGDKDFFELPLDSQEREVVNVKFS